MKDLTYIKVKEGKLWASDMVKPNKSHYVIDDDGLERYASATEAFNQSFVEAGNGQEVGKILVDLHNRGKIKLADGLYWGDDGFYPVSGLQFIEKITCDNACDDSCENDNCGRKVAILSLKQEQQSEEKEAKRYTVEEISSRLREGLSKFGCKSTIAGKWVLEDNIYHVLRELKD